MKIDKLTSVYNSLLSCDKQFFSSLSKHELETCHKVADYFLEVSEEKVNEADLQQLQRCMDHFKQRRWMRNGFEISNPSLESIYQKLHPTRTTIGAISADILSYHILPAAAEFQMIQVNKAWAVYSQADEVWQGIAKKIGFSHLSAAPGQMHVVVKRFCKEFMANLAQLPEATEEIKEWMKGEITTEKMLKLVDWRKARDTIVVWKEIIEDLNLSMPEELVDESKDKREQAKHLAQWLNDNPLVINRLKDLALPNQALAFLPPEIERLTALKRLDLSYNQLTTLPPEIGALTALRNLDLKHNQLTTLPSEIGRLTALRSLDLDHNKLTKLPSEIGHLIVLAFLHLCHNKLTHLPPEIGCLTHLKWVHLDHNQLTSLPSEIGQWIALISLFLNHNALTELPSGIGHLTALQVLEVTNNQLTTLPSEIGGLAAVHALTMSSNKLLTLPPTIGALRTLEVFYLNDNHLIDLPPAIGRLIAMKKLDLNNNELTTLPSEMGHLDALQLLFLDGNKLSFIPPEIKALPELAKIWM